MLTASRTRRRTSPISATGSFSTGSVTRRSAASSAATSTGRCRKYGSPSDRRSTRRRTESPVRENFATILETVADVRADQIAATHGDRTRTWQQLDDRASRLAAFLADAGIGAEDRVAIA